MTTLNSVATVKSLKVKLHGLKGFALKVNGDIPQILAKFVEIQNCLRVAGVPVDSTLHTRLFVCSFKVQSRKEVCPIYCIEGGCS